MHRPPQPVNRAFRIGICESAGAATKRPTGQSHATAASPARGRRAHRRPDRKIGSAAFKRTQANSACCVPCRVAGQASAVSKAVMLREARPNSRHLCLTYANCDTINSVVPETGAKVHAAIALLSTGADIRCNAMVRLLTELGFSVRDGRKQGHKVVTHPGGCRRRVRTIVPAFEDGGGQRRAHADQGELRPHRPSRTTGHYGIRALIGKRFRNRALRCDPPPSAESPPRPGTPGPPAPDLRQGPQARPTAVAARPAPARPGS